MFLTVIGLGVMPIFHYLVDHFWLANLPAPKDEAGDLLISLQLERGRVVRRLHFGYCLVCVVAMRALIQRSQWALDL